jgi:hypothetical protein
MFEIKALSSHKESRRERREITANQLDPLVRNRGAF